MIDKKAERLDVESMKKYGFTGKRRKITGEIWLNQIIALKDFGNVKKGETGGSTKGYFKKLKVARPFFRYYFFDGSDMEEEDSGYFESDDIDASIVPASKFVFCAECEREIGQLEEEGE
ncbi:TPA: hypothetical protein ACGY2I_001142 [Listeria monocytogenes]|nr:hypothetical protein [Listeria monocytogenes]HBL8226592.1 hypothetical protein [Listeria monocytogenes]